MGPPEELPEQLITSTAQRLGATYVPIEQIQNAWKSYALWSNSGHLSTDNGKQLFIANRLREYECFEVGNQSTEDIGTGCILHFFDIYTTTKNLTDEEYDEFMYNNKTKKNETNIAATKLWKLLDSYPVNAVAAKATSFNRGKKKKD